MTILPQLSLFEVPFQRQGNLCNVPVDYIINPKRDIHRLLFCYDGNDQAFETCDICVEIVHCGDMKVPVLEGQGCFTKQQLQCLLLGGQQRLANIQPRSTKRSRSAYRYPSAMAIAAEPLVAETNTSTQRPDRDGRFGRFGGKYVRFTVHMYCDIL